MGKNTKPHLAQFKSYQNTRIYSKKLWTDLISQLHISLQIYFVNLHNAQKNEINLDNSGILYTVRNQNKTTYVTNELVSICRTLRYFKLNKTYLSNLYIQQFKISLANIQCNEVKVTQKVREHKKEKELFTTYHFHIFSFQSQPEHLICISLPINQQVLLYPETFTSCISL